MPQLCLGSAQFGMNYGITNEDGKVSTDELIQILHLASVFPFHILILQKFMAMPKCV